MAPVPRPTARPAATADSGTGGGRTEGVDYSGTNNQVQGVDEADLVKTDGYHLYALNGNRLHIFGTPNFGDLVPESVTQLEGHPTEMLLDANANRAVVFSNHRRVLAARRAPAQAAGRLAGDYLVLADQRADQDHGVRHHRSHRAATRTRGLLRGLVRHGSQGRLDGADGRVLVAVAAVVYNWWNVYENNGHDKDATKQAMARQIQKLHLDDLIPKMYVRTPDGHFVTNSLSTSSCQSFYRPSDSHARGIASVISFDLLGDNFFWDADHVVSNWPTFYESHDRFVIAENAHDSWWYYWFRDDPEQTNVHVFDSSQAGQYALPRLGPHRCLGVGSVRDRRAGWVDPDRARRAVAGGTTARSPKPKSENHIFVLAHNGRTTTPSVISAASRSASGCRDAVRRQPGLSLDVQVHRSADHRRPLGSHEPARRRSAPGAGHVDVPPTDGRSPTAVDRHRRDAAGARPTSPCSTSRTSRRRRSTRRCRSASPAGGRGAEALWEHKAFQYWAPAGLLAIPSSNYNYNNGDYRLPIEARADLRRSDERHARVRTARSTTATTTTSRRATGRTPTFAARCSWVITSTRSATRRSPFTAPRISERLMNKCYRATPQVIGGGGGGACGKCVVA